MFQIIMPFGILYVAISLIWFFLWAGTGDGYVNTRMAVLSFLWPLMILKAFWRETYKFLRDWNVD